MLQQTAEIEQRYVQSFWRDQLAVEFMCALENARQPVNSLGRARIGDGREKKPATTTACKLIHGRLERNMNLSV